MDVSRRIVKTPWAQEFLEFVLKGETAAAHVLLKGCQRIRNDKVLRVTALLGAIHEGREALVNILIDDELQVTTALQKASASGQCALLRAMLDYELCDEIDDESWNLHDALCGLIDVEHDTGNEYTAIMEPLVKHPNYDPNFKDRHARDSTVLNYASGKGKYSEGAVRLLLACKDIDVNMQDEDFMSRPGETALHYLSEHGSETMVQLLLAHTNIDINVQSSDGFTPLHPAVRASRDETILRTLLNAPGIDLRLTDDNDMTPLHWALCDQNAPAINMLLEKDPDCINDPRTESLLGLPFNWEVRTLEGNSAYFFNHETSRKAWTQELDNVIEIEPSNGEPDLSAYKDSGRLEIRTFAQRMAAQWLMRAYSDGTGLYQYYDIDGLLLFQHNERFDIRRFVSGANIETIARFLTAPIAVAEQPEG